MPRDAAISVSLALPAANANNTTPGLDLSAVLSGPNDWRLGYILATVPAMPNNTDSTKTILLDMQLAPADLTSGVFPPQAGTYAATSPVIEGQIAGVATTGSLATTIKFPLPPYFAGFIRFKQTVPTGAGDNTGVSITYEWVFE